MRESEPAFTRLHLIRHAQTDWNRTHTIQGINDDIPLNAVGLEQTASLANHLSKHYQIDIIYASKAKRAQQTATLIGSVINRPVHKTGILNEFDFGIFSGSCTDEIESKFPDHFYKFRHFMMTNRDQSTPRPEIKGGETSKQVEIRAKAFISKILSEHEGKSIAAVTHGTFIRCMLTFLSGKSLQDFIPFWVDNTSISVVDFFGPVPIIRRVNDTCHLNQGPLEFLFPQLF